MNVKKFENFENDQMDHFTKEDLYKAFIAGDTEGWRDTWETEGNRNKEDFEKWLSDYKKFKGK